MAPLFLIACGTPDPEMEAFAQCLNEAGAEYYGSYKCGACQQQNKILGDIKKSINYIECGDGIEESQTELCQLEGIKSTPTWRFDNGNEMTGYKTIEDLAAASSCPLPGEEQSVMYQ